jgi:cyclopropane fatty-acyl-phospholipid synthase-like methyltransferase
MSDSAFWDRLAPKYYRQRIDNLAAYEQTLERVRAHLKPTDRVIELGCGTGGTAVLLAPHVARWVASDGSKEMIRCAEVRLADERAPSNVELRVATMGSAPAGAPYDVACAFNVLHLVDDLAEAVRFLRSVLVPGGLAISKTPCLREHGIAIRALLPVLRMVGRAPPVCVFDTSELEQAFVREGFRLEESRTFDTAKTARFLVARAP